MTASTRASARSSAHGASPDPRAGAAAAELLGYCMPGPRDFAAANGPGPTAAAAEARLEAALTAGDSPHARLSSCSPSTPA